MAITFLYPVLVAFLCATVQCFCESHECELGVEHAGASLIQRDPNVKRTTGRLIEETSLSSVVQESLVSPGNSKVTPQELAQEYSTQGDEQHLSFSRVAGRLQGPGFCRRHPCSLVQVATDKRPGIGKTASLTQSGYEEVADAKDDEEMKKFVHRLIERYDCKVIDEGGLMGFVPWFSGTAAKQSLEQLENALLFALLADGEPWIVYQNTAKITGETAELNLEGYVNVACIRNNEEMKNFARRLCRKLSIKIKSEGGFEGMIQYYSGAATFQSFDTLVSELKAAAHAPRSWASFEHE